VHETFPLWAVDTPILLCQGYQGEAFNLGTSAMPSMHNGAALLFALIGWCHNRKLGIALFTFTAVVFVGSVHLGWHYAIDGYAGFAIALAAWWLAGVIAKWREKTSWARGYAVATARLS
jgi:membrane-associated phospholipid phosphatase